MSKSSIAAALGARGASLFLCVPLALVVPVTVQAGAYVFAGEANGVDVVAHPPNYFGAGGEVTVSVCIDPVATNAALLEIPVKNIVSTINAFVPTSPNLLFGANNDIPPGSFDFESLTLHEFGHCLSLAHPNQGQKTGVTGAVTDATQSTFGVDDVYDFDDGIDDVQGSNDDLRNDDVNLHYFQTNVNNPFLLPAKVDATNYTRDVANLPAGHSYPANAGRDVGALLGFNDTEANMQQGQGSDEDQRALQADDAATLMYGGTGLDETVGGGDDYTIKMVYAGQTDTCDIVVKSDTGTGFASCGFGGAFLNANHIRLTSGTFRYNPGAVTWYFNQVEACDDIEIDYAHDAKIAHTACGKVTTKTGFTVGASGDVNLTGTSVEMQNGTEVTGQLVVAVTPP